MECVFPEEKVPDVGSIPLGAEESALPVGIPENYSSLGAFSVLAATFSYFPAIQVHKG